LVPRSALWSGQRSHNDKGAVLDVELVVKARDAINEDQAFGVVEPEILADLEVLAVRPDQGKACLLFVGPFVLAWSLRKPKVSDPAAREARRIEALEPLLLEEEIVVVGVLK